ncbi:MAG: CBS domain-containing protein [Nanoarchaeota archaeon]
MNKNVKTITKNETIFKATNIMKESFVGQLVVIENSFPIGILTERDICYKVVSLNLDPKKTPVEKIMTKTLIKAHINDTISEISRRMSLAKIKQIPIIDENNSLVGIISSSDLIRIVASLHRDIDGIN